jgi:hypothetical protein
VRGILVAHQKEHSMDAVNMTPGPAGTAMKDAGILYPLMLIAAAAVIVFSIAGIATMMGWMPGALSSDAAPRQSAPPAAAPKQAAPPQIEKHAGAREQAATGQGGSRP